MSVDKERRNKRQNDFVKETYDRFTLTLPKGKKDYYRATAEAKGMSLNAFINKLLEDSAKNPPAE